MKKRYDGVEVTNVTAIDRALPYIMPKRYDAMTWAQEELDESLMRDYIHQKRREGHTMTHMTMVLAAYYKAIQKNPKINYFIMNKRLYKRNHFCVSFVMLKTREDGTPDETTLKIYFTPEDNIFTIDEKIRKLVEENSVPSNNNNTDKFVNFLFSVPGLATFVIGLAKWLDKHNIMPKQIIELSPFHTSLFITNLASINTNCIWHHIYEFGTTSVFICMGKLIPNPNAPEGSRKRLMPMSVVMDERIATGIEYSQFWKDFLKYMKHPEVLETPFGENLD